MFIQFLTMGEQFYEYTRLYIKCKDDLYNDKFYIKSRLGAGATSIVYSLINKDNNRSNGPILKICTDAKYSKYFQNEVNILNILKESDKSQAKDNFNKYFETIWYSSPQGKFICFEKVLSKLKSLTLIQSTQLIDAVQYLYQCHIIHRDIRPENLMYTSGNEDIKLIDFGFAAMFDNNEASKIIHVEGTITLGDRELLKNFPTLPYDSLSHKCYEYKPTFDLYCALNVIMIMTHEDVKDEFYSIKTSSRDSEDRFKKHIRFGWN